MSLGTMGAGPHDGRPPQHGDAAPRYCTPAGTAPFQVLSGPPIMQIWPCTNAWARAARVPPTGSSRSAPAQNGTISEFWHCFLKIGSRSTKFSLRRHLNITGFHFRGDILATMIKQVRGDLLPVEIRGHSASGPAHLSGVRLEWY